MIARMLLFFSAGVFASAVDVKPLMMPGGGSCMDHTDKAACGAAVCGEDGGAERACVFDNRSSTCKCPVGCGEYATPLSCTEAVSPKDGLHCLLFDRDHTQQRCVSLSELNVFSCEDIGAAAAAAGIRAPVSHVCELAYSPRAQHLKCVWSRDTMSCSSP